MEGYVVSAALALLGLLLAFTFALSVDRFETRRGLVLQESNANGTAYLRSQALIEPHRSCMSKVLVDYMNNRIALATASRADQPRLLAVNDQLLTICGPRRSPPTIRSRTRRLPWPSWRPSTR